MGGSILGFRAQAQTDAEALLDCIGNAEDVIVTTIERECEALRSGRMLAAKALHTRLGDAARFYVDAIKAARASLWTIEHVLPGARAMLEERRAAFSSLLQIELAVLAAERAAAGEEDLGTGFETPPYRAPDAPPAPHGRAAARR